MKKHDLEQSAPVEQEHLDKRVLIFARLIAKLRARKKPTWMTRARKSELPMHHAPVQPGVRVRDR